MSPETQDQFDQFKLLKEHYRQAAEHGFVSRSGLSDIYRQLERVQTARKELTQEDRAFLKECGIQAN